MEETIVNRVSTSGLISLDLEDLYAPGERITYDLKQNLFMDLILKEKDFRTFLKENDWSLYQDSHVAIGCSADAIVPTWAYMLLATYLEPYVKTLVFGDLDELENRIYGEIFDKLDWTPYQDARVVVKGCSKIKIPISVYVELSQRLKPMVKSLMFGEPCSTVPLYKAKANV
jgi:Protein of unknown function (DUF2480)